MLRKFVITAALFLLLAPCALFAADAEFDSFWADFKLALLSNNIKKVSDLSFFNNDNERKDFPSAYRDIFDSTAQNKIIQTPSDRIIKADVPDKDDTKSELSGITLPPGIKELYYLTVEYSVTSDSVTSVSGTRNFRQAYVFAKVSGKYKFIGSFTLG